MSEYSLTTEFVFIRATMTGARSLYRNRCFVLFYFYYYFFIIFTAEIINFKTTRQHEKEIIASSNTPDQFWVNVSKRNQHQMYQMAPRWSNVYEIGSQTFSSVCETKIYIEQSLSISNTPKEISLFPSGTKNVQEMRPLDIICFFAAVSIKSCPFSNTNKVTSMRCEK